MTTQATEHPALFNDDMVRAILSGMKTQTRRPIKTQPGNGISSLFVDDTEVGPRWQYQVPVEAEGVVFNETRQLGRCPFGVPGDTLWVREAWRPCYSSGPLNWHVLYRADGVRIHREEREADLKYMRSGDHWRPSIHMPRWASRINLPVTRVWVERIQDITDEDAAAEGLSEFTIGLPKRPVTNGFVAASMVLGFCNTLPRSRRRFLATCGSAAFAGVAGWLAGGGNFPQSLTCRHGFALLWDSIYADKGLGWDVNPWVFASSFRQLGKS